MIIIGCDYHPAFQQSHAIAAFASSLYASQAYNVATLQHDSVCVGRFIAPVARHSRSWTRHHCALQREDCCGQ